MNYGQNIYFIEGLKTLAYEIAEQMDPLPDHIIVPIGNGSIYQGMWRGFREMLEDGRVDRMPRLHGAQTEETQPVVAAFEGREWTPYEGEAASRANGIGVTNPPRPHSPDGSRQGVPAAASCPCRKRRFWSGRGPWHRLRASSWNPRRP